MNVPFGSHIDDPDAMAKRLIQRAHNRDGLPELLVGFSFVVTGGLSYAQAVLPPNSAALKAVAVALSLFIPLFCFGSPWAIRSVRNRYLIHKFGYVQFPSMNRKQVGAGIMIAMLSLTALLALIIGVSEPHRWVLAFTGLMGGALAAWCGRMPRFLIGGLLMALTGVVLAFTGISLQLGFAVLFGFTGIIALVSGSVVLVRLLRAGEAP